MVVPELSIVVPVYGCASTLRELVDRIRQSLESVVNSYEVILVDDGTVDNSWNLITNLAERDSRIVGLRLSRNFGQQAAIFAGLSVSNGSWVVVMDCDLQDLPEEIPNLLRKANEGYEHVVAVRTNRQDNWLKTITSKVYLKILSFMLDQQISGSVHNFGIYSKRMIKVLSDINEQGKTFGLLVLWAGFSRFELEVEHGARKSGSSGYSIATLIRLAFSTIVNYSDKPLRLMVKFGFLLTGTTFLYGFWVLAQFTFTDQLILGWTSIVSLIAFLFGALFSSIGITGLYVGNTFAEAKGRPSFIVWKTTVSEFEETN
jgi:polyisoprenyl-phosphate glycosyltransferase